MTDDKTDRALENRARRIAKKFGYVASKSRRRKHTMDNVRHFAIIDPRINCIVAGSQFDMTASDVIAYFED